MYVPTHLDPNAINEIQHLLLNSVFINQDKLTGLKKKKKAEECQSQVNISNQANKSAKKSAQAKRNQKKQAKDPKQNGKTQNDCAQ